MLGYVKSSARRCIASRSDAIGIHVLRKYSGETDMDVLRPTWVLFALHGDMMFPSLERAQRIGDPIASGRCRGRAPPEKPSISVGRSARGARVLRDADGRARPHRQERSLIRRNCCKNEIRAYGGCCAQERSQALQSMKPLAASV